jgi:2-keto-4-pentenoate hydratase/2-oxohepta-3-ene-1,7-dioic acid hydratase in catechol pathway
MRLVTFATTPGPSREHWRLGLLVASADLVVDVSAMGSQTGFGAAGRPPFDFLDWFDLDAPWAAFVRQVADDLRRPGELDRLRREGVAMPRDGVVLAAPVPRPGKIVCVGLNYRDHAAESRLPVPDSPVIFAKFPTAVIGPETPIRLPASSERVDFEAELAVVIGRRARRVSGAGAMDVVAGLTIANDVTARDFQKLDGQWVRGKSCDTFAPLGPALVTLDEIADPHALRIRLRLNGAVMQDSNTDQFVFGIPALIAFLTRTLTLEPGDVILTGTPPGVGFARRPPVYLKPGDVVEVEIEGLGVLRNPVASGE